MRIFKQFALYILCIALVVFLVSAAILLPWLHTPTTFHDQTLRSRLAGQIDTLIIGQSYTMNGVMPPVLDEMLGTRTYNLSGSLMPIYGQKYMLEKELARNPVKHILLEITPDTFTTDERTTYGNGDSYIIARLDSFRERMDYLLRCVPLSDWPNIYARMLLQSLRSAAYTLMGRPEKLIEENMGFNPEKTKIVALSADSAPSQRMSMNIFHEPLEENIRAYEELLALCVQSGCDVTMIYTPVSHAKVWQLYDQETFRTFARELADKYQVPFFDFNLLRSRYELFSDEFSFSDDNHLSQEGAAVFTKEMAEVLSCHRAGEDVSPLFFSSYFETIQNSVYNQ